MDSTLIHADYQSLIFEIRGCKVMIDADLAALYETETKALKQQVKRNIDRFPDDFMFELTREEKVQLVTNCDRLSNLKHSSALPLAFTENGVLQIANLINTDIADSVSVFVIRAFVEMRRTIIAQQKALVSSHELVNVKSAGSRTPNVAMLQKELIPKLQTTIDRMLNSVIDTKTGTTVKDEALDILKESIGHLKEQLRNKGLQNEEITARVTKLLAEAENQRAAARKTRAESEQLEFMNTIRKLRLVLDGKQQSQISN